MKHTTQYKELQTKCIKHNVHILNLCERYCRFVEYKYKQNGIVFATKGLMIRGYEGSDIFTHDYKIYTLTHKVGPVDASRYTLKDNSVYKKIEQLMALRFYINE